MIAPLSKRLPLLARQEWLHKSVRTLFVVAPGLGFFVSTGDQRGVMFAFAALCLSVPYGDHIHPDAPVDSSPATDAHLRAHLYSLPEQRAPW
jgi:hypothetical protein